MLISSLQACSQHCHHHATCSGLCCHKKALMVVMFVEHDHAVREPQVVGVDLCTPSEARIAAAFITGWLPAQSLQSGAEHSILSLHMHALP